MYTSRLLLDPNSIINKQKEDKERLYNAWNALAEGVGKKIGESFAEQNRKDYLANQKDVENLEDLPEWQDPQFRAAAYSFAKGDRSGIDNYYQTKALNKAREAEAQKAKDIQTRELDNLEDAIAHSEDWNTTASLYEKAIQKANELGDIERMNRLKEEAATVDKTEAMWKAQKPEEKIDPEKAFAKLKEKIKFRIQNLPTNEEERNAEIDSLNKLVSDYQITDIKVPSKKRTKRTAEEEDEYMDLLEIKSDYDKGLRNQWTTVQQKRLDELSKLKSFGSK